MTQSHVFLKISAHKSLFQIICFTLNYLYPPYLEKTTVALSLEQIYT